MRSPECSQSAQAFGWEARLKDDLDNLRKAFKTKTGKSFDFSRLLNEYEIDEDNPISVGK